MGGSVLDGVLGRPDALRQLHTGGQIRIMPAQGYSVGAPVELGVELIGQGASRGYLNDQPRGQGVVDIVPPMGGCFDIGEELASQAALIVTPTVTLGRLVGSHRSLRTGCSWSEASAGSGPPGLRRLRVSVIPGDTFLANFGLSGITDTKVRAYKYQRK